MEKKRLISWQHARNSTLQTRFNLFFLFAIHFPAFLFLLVHDNESSEHHHLSLA